MKIGILTFHWATNYGAVLQCYALQKFLCDRGYEVEVINYKPMQYDETLTAFVRDRKFYNLLEYIQKYKFEKALKVFRQSRFHLTQRVRTCTDVGLLAKSFDVIISGSDQVVNPTFLLNGEAPSTITPTYFLGFPFAGKRIGYALSFGCTIYPEEARLVALQYIKMFDSISVRENTGINIVRSMGREDAILTPDPTFLQHSEFYLNLAGDSNHVYRGSYIYSFFIRNIRERKKVINSLFGRDKKVHWNNDDGDYTIQRWLSKIQHADLVLTDSFHCVVMCLFLHTPFIVVTEIEGNVAMNDRLYTLLGCLSMDMCIVYKKKLNHLLLGNMPTYNWDLIDEKLESIREIGIQYLDNNINQCSY